MEDLRIEIKLDEGAKMPTPADDYSVGYDVYSLEDTIVYTGRNVIGTGVHVNLPFGFSMILKPRSGFSAQGIEGEKACDSNIDMLIDCFLKGTEYKPSFDSGITRRFNADVIDGIIDPGYHNAIGVIINNNDEPFKLRKGTRIAQALFIKCERPTFNIVDKFEGYDRGGGFGHSGIK